MTRDEEPPRRRRQSMGIGQRLFALFVFVFLAYLIWLALTGQYDTEVNRFAAWLHRNYTAFMRQF